MNSRGLVSLSDWLRRDAETMDPENMRFRAKPANPKRPDCAGCIFKGQLSSVCEAATRAASRAGIPDCDDRDSETGNTFIYVLIDVDPRQMDIVKDIENFAE